MIGEFKISGCCTVCDEPTFEVLARWSENERYPGEPKRLGPPTDDATRITFELLDGSKSDLTFCGKCTESLNPAQYVEIWRKVIRGWIREMSLDPKPTPDWFVKSFENGILGEMGRKKWKDLHG